MNTIEVPIECKIPEKEHVDYEGLGIDPPELETEYRISTIFVSHIASFYPDSENEGCLILMMNEDCYYTNLKYEELKSLLNN